MTDPRWRRIEDAVDRLLDLPEDERPGFLDQVAAGDDEVRSDIESWLAACLRPGDFLQQPVLDRAAPFLPENPAVARSLVGQRIGPYRITGEAGRGGMGVVYLAERSDDQFQQRVALKLVRPGKDADQHIIQRFLSERRILATLEHPNIARLLDGGVTDDGLPWFAMEYVDGLPLNRFAVERRLSIRQRVELFLLVSGAVQLAHRNLVVHRDLKPSNILVTADGTVKILDFGIAKLLDATVAGEPEQTATGMRMLTPEYASPEQLRGEPVSTASDVYSLGVILYQLLAGQRPRAAGSRTTSEWERAVADLDVIVPSVAGGMTELRGDLDAIVLKTLRREPDRRYASVDLLALDLRHYLDGLPVSARADTWRYRTATFVRRHRWAVAAGLAFVIALAGFGIFSLAQARRITVQRNTAQQVARFLQDLFLSPDPYQGLGRDVRVRDVLDSAAIRIETELRDQPAVRAELMVNMGLAYYGIGEYGQAEDVFLKAVEIWRASPEPARRNYLTVGLVHLGSAQRLQGNYRGAEASFRESARLERQITGLDWTAPQELLASVLRARGRLAEADSILRGALIQNRRADDSVRLANSLRSLGHVRLDQGNPVAAESLYRETLAIHRVLWDADHPEIASGMSNLANALRDQGRYAEAESLYAAATALALRTLGETHMDVAIMRADQARMLSMRGDSAGALALYRQTANYLQRPGVLPLEVSLALLRFGELLRARGFAAEARPLLERAMRGLAEARGGEDSLTLRAARALGR